MDTKRRVLPIILLILLSLVLLNLGPHSRISMIPGISAPDPLVASIYSPIQKATDQLLRSIKGVWRGYLSLVGVKRENTELRRQLDLKEGHILSLKDQLRVAGKEAVMMETIDKLGLQGILANVIGYDPNTQLHTLWLSKGGRDGVRIDQPVMTDDGLVGRILTVFDRSSMLLLLVDPHFAVDVINERTRMRSLVVGWGQITKLKRHLLLTQLEYLRIGREVQPGDLLVTSGLNGMYPAGIPVGHVIEYQVDEDEVLESASVLPAVDVTKLEQVMILSGGVPSTFP